MAPVIHWFRRDLRLEDNTALNHALLSGDPVVPLFVFDDHILGHRRVGAHRLRFLVTALRDLDRELREQGSGLLVRRGDAAREVNHLAEQTGAWAVYFNRDHTPYARQRDTRATRGLQLTGIVTQVFDDLLLVPPYATIGEDGMPPLAHEAFAERWFAAFDLDPGPVEPPGEGRYLPAAELGDGGADWAEALGVDALEPSAWPGATPASARERLRRFTADSLAGYPGDRDRPGDEDRTTRLSAALKLGTISVREVARAAIKRGAADPRSRPGAERVVGNLAWRDYAAHLLHGNPMLLREPLHPDRPAQPAPAPDAEARLGAWRTGRTGYPVVDAGMRQLLAEGWVPAGVREVAATFLARVLGCDWRLGERHFIENLVDLDLASNDLGWQRAAGRPVIAAGRDDGLGVVGYGERHDPEGAYVRRWVPELAAVPAAHVHRPWAMPPSAQLEARCRVGIDYPEPIVSPGGGESDVQPG
jgi:deoxyribodipyrimidine photo-lyase